MITETRLSVLDRNSKNVAQYLGASHISVVLVKNAKPGFCCHVIYAYSYYLADISAPLPKE